MDTRLDLKLSEEQELFICKALEGKNLLVDGVHRQRKDHSDIPGAVQSAS